MANTPRKHNIKRNKNYSKKHDISYKEYLNLGEDTLYSMKSSDLRKALVVINQEANKRLDTWAKKKTKGQDIPELRVLNERLVPRNGKFTYNRFSTKPSMRKAEIIADILTRNEFLMTKQSTVKGFKEVETARDKIVKDYFKNYADVDYKDLKAKPNLERVGKLLTRLRDNNYLASKAQTTGYSQGSPTVLTTAFNVISEKPRISVDDWYNEITNRLDKAEHRQVVERQLEQDILTSI